MLQAVHSCNRRRRLLLIKVRDGFTLGLLLLGQFNASGKFHKEHRVREDQGLPNVQAENRASLELFLFKVHVDFPACIPT